MADALKLFPLPDDCNIFYLSYVKDALVAQFGIEEGFAKYRDELSPRASINHARPVRIEEKTVAPLRETALSTSTSFSEIHPSGEPFVIPPPASIGEGERLTLAGTARAFYVACLSGARIHSRSPFLRVGDSTALDYEPRELRETDDRWNVDHYVFAAHGNVAREIAYDQPVLELDEAFGSLLGTSTMAWGHWVGDYVPRYVSAALSGRLPPVPVLIDAGMPATHKELLEMLLPQGTSVVEVAPDYEVRVGRLWCAPSLGYSPLLPHFNDKFAWERFCTVPSRWMPVLTAMGRSADAAGVPKDASERIYLARKPFRWTKMLNYQAIESLARSRGFRVLYPEDHSVRELAAYVRNARYLMGPVGSQMANAFFARPGTRVCYLTHPLLMGAWLYHLRAVDVDVTMIAGPAVNVNDAPEPPTFGYPHHADYEIDVDRLSGFLDGWLTP